MLEIRNNLFKANNYIANYKGDNSKANNTKADNHKANNCEKDDNYKANNCKDYCLRQVLDSTTPENVGPLLDAGLIVGTIYGFVKPLDVHPVISVMKGAALGIIGAVAIGGIIGSIDYYLCKSYYRGKCNKEQ